ncbi:hypothetical protein [Flavobacterium sp.]|uniref:hypothetical protein n=1 Tax=Flavobacterium sp. TaxID=239 RepID=UPI00262BA7CE|nr:hypothetical protein [Flavobacterium sp.]
MKSLNGLMQDIIRLTTKIETDYPELYKYLNETPLGLTYTPKEKISTKILSNIWRA